MLSRQFTHLFSLIFGIATPACLAGPFHATNLGALPGGPDLSIGAAINDYGQIVGLALTPPGDGHRSEYRGFLWTPTVPNDIAGAMVALPLLSDPAVYDARAAGINDLGQVIGSNSNANYQRVFLWTPSVPNGDVGTNVDLSGTVPTYDKHYATDINSIGQVVGSKYFNTTAASPFLWTPGAANGNSGTATAMSPPMLNPEAINRSGQVAGSAGTRSGAALFTPSTANSAVGTTTVFPLPQGTDYSHSLGINDAGVVVGYVHNVSLHDTAFVWNPDTANGTTGSLTLLPGFTANTSSRATDINNLGNIVGWSGSRLTYTGTAAALWTANGLIDLNSCLDVPLPAGWSLDEAVAINDYGQIVVTGYYWDGDFESRPTTNAFLLTPVPEPGMTLLLCLSVLTRCKFHRHRR